MFYLWSSDSKWYIRLYLFKYKKKIGRRTTHEKVSSRNGNSREYSVRSLNNVSSELKEVIILKQSACMLGSSQLVASV